MIPTITAAKAGTTHARGGGDPLLIKEGVYQSRALCGRVVDGYLSQTTDTGESVDCKRCAAKLPVAEESATPVLSSPETVQEWSPRHPEAGRIRHGRIRMIRSQRRAWMKKYVKQLDKNIA